MKEVRYTLTTDGPTDAALIPLLNWFLKEQGVAGPISPIWADLRRLRLPPRGLLDRIKCALDLYPCDLLFVHRDAENQSPERRHAEICQAMDGARRSAGMRERSPACRNRARMTDAERLRARPGPGSP